MIKLSFIILIKIARNTQSRWMNSESALNICHLKKKNCSIVNSNSMLLCVCTDECVRAKCSCVCTCVGKLIKFNCQSNQFVWLKIIGNIIHPYMHARRCVYANTIRVESDVLLCFEPQYNLDNSHVCVCCVCACVLCVSVCQCHLLNCRAKILPYFSPFILRFLFCFCFNFFGKFIRTNYSKGE